MMKCFRVYTEDTNRDVVFQEAKKRWPNGFTFTTGTGCWAGVAELCLIIEIIRESSALPTVQRFATDIKRLNNQVAVLITETDITFSELI